MANAPYGVGDRLPEVSYLPSSVGLFRYSAVTWNPHRIHFDVPYAQGEGHRGLAVHSHLRAALALRCVSEGLGPQWLISATSYRLRKPAYALTRLSYGARVQTVEGDRMVLELLEYDADGAAGLEGEVTVTRIEEQSRWS